MAEKAKIIDFLLTGYRHPTTDVPLNGGKVYTYSAGTLTVATTWTDRDKTTPATNPVVLDSSGRAEIYGDGIYTFVIKDASGASVETIEYAEYAAAAVFVAHTSAANLAALQSASGATGDVIYMIGRTTSGDGGEGIFRWDATDLSSTLVVSTVTTTAVNATTDTCTKTSHGFATGYGGVSTTAVNGLSTNTVYWTIRVDANNFKLASSYSNAMAGTAVDLTGTTNFTFKRLVDPLCGIYLPGASDLTGTSGCWVRSHAGTVYPEWFGADSSAIHCAVNFLGDSGGGIVSLGGGDYVASNVKFRAGVEIVGSGYGATYVTQGEAANPAFDVTSDVTTGQLHGVGIKQLTIRGHASATVEAVHVEATTPYVVHNSEFDYRCISVYSGLVEVCTSASELYENKFKVEVIGASGTAATTKGVYNHYDLFLVLCATGVALTDTGGSSIIKVIADGSLTFSGQNNTIIKPVVETIYAASSPSTAAIVVNGYNNTLISPTITNVDGTKLASNVGLYLSNAHTVIDYRVYGATFPDYPINLSTLAKCTFVGGLSQGVYTLAQSETADLLAKQAFIGDCSSYLGSTCPVFSEQIKIPTIPFGVTAYASLGTEKTPASGTIYVARLNLSQHKTVTGVGVLNGATVGTNKVIVALFNADGVKLATSALAGITTSGANVFQQCALTAARVIPPGTYYIGVQYNGTTDTFRSISANTFIDVVTGSTAGSFGTIGDITPPTTFTASIGPIGYIY